MRSVGLLAICWSLGLTPGCERASPGDQPQPRGGSPPVPASASGSATDAGAVPEGTEWGDRVDKLYGPTFAVIRAGLAQNGGSFLPITGAVPRCEDTETCTKEGLCVGTVGECVAATVDSCRAAYPCRLEAACTMSEGRCIVGTRDLCGGTLACEHAGQCSKRDGACVAITKKDCKQSIICQAAGLCSPKDKLCVANSDADCQGSDSCRLHGFCRAQHGGCVAHSFPSSRPW